MRRIFLRLLLFIPVAAFMGLVNYWADPAQIFKGDEIGRKIASLLLQGMNVALRGDYDERAVQRYYIEGVSSRKEIITLGSSRSMQISSEMFSGRSFFNNAVSGATLEDDIAIYELYHRRGLLPSQIILGIDPWVLNRNHGQVRWKYLREYYESGIRRIPNADVRHAYAPMFVLGKYSELFSPNYFQASVGMIVEDIGRLQLFKTSRYYATLERDLEVPIKCSDGSLRYARKIENISTTQAREAAKAYVSSGSVYSLDRFISLDGEYMRELEGFLDFMRRDGVEPIIFLPPYHPYVYHALVDSDRYRVILTVEKYIRELVSQKSLKLVGSYDPTELSIGEEEYFDGAHLRPSAVQKLISPILKDKK